MFRVYQHEFRKKLESLEKLNAENKLSPAQANPARWYNRRFPIVVLAKEWEIQRSKVSMLLSKKKTGKVRIEIRRKAIPEATSLVQSPNPSPTRSSPKHYIRNVSPKKMSLDHVENGMVAVALNNWSQHLMEGDIIVFNILKKDIDGSSSVSHESDMIRTTLSDDSILYTTERSSLYSNEVRRMSNDDSTAPITNLNVSDIQIVHSKELDALDLEQPVLEKWSIKSSSSISRINLQRDQNRCNVTLVSMCNKRSKDNVALTFGSVEEAKEFEAFVKELKKMYRSIASNAISNHIDSISIDSEVESIDFLIEIISATDLKESSKGAGTCDPFVSVRYGGERVHKTDAIKKDVNPIWTIKTKSVFIFTLYTDEYFNADLVFEVKDMKEIYLKLGQVYLSPKELIEANGERVEKKLTNMGKDPQGYIAIRCKRASQSDVDFFRTPQKQRRAIKKNQILSIKPRSSKQSPLMQFDASKLIDGQRHYFVRPMDPTGEFTLLTNEQINETCELPSRYWTEAGSGTLGELYVEVLKIDGLQNFDTNMPGSKTEAYTMFVCEDAVVTSEVIKDSMNPRFMPWTRRAFKFNVAHISSPLFVGVFDKNKSQKVGRISIPLQMYKSNTEYNVFYDLYDSSEVIKRDKKGVIHLRISINWKSQRKLFLDAMNPEQFTVNFESKRDYSTAQYVIEGYSNVRSYNFKTLLGYIHELSLYQIGFLTTLKAIKETLLWRGHYDVGRIKLPIHSVILLGAGIILTEFPQFAVSVFFGGIAWIMLGLLGRRRRRPLMWDRPSSYFHILLRLLTGKTHPEIIKPNENIDKDMVFMEKEKARLKRYEERTEKFWSHILEDIDEVDEMRNEVLFSDSMRQPKLKVFRELYPLQKNLAQITSYFRFAERIVNWDQMHISFWITTSAIFLCFASLFLWDEFYLWGKRFIVYTFLGPWMKLVDIFYFQKLDTQTRKEHSMNEAERESIARNRFSIGNIKTQIAKEELLKSAAMKEHCKYQQ